MSSGIKKLWFLLPGGRSNQVHPLKFLSGADGPEHKMLCSGMPKQVGNQNSRSVLWCFGSFIDLHHTHFLSLLVIMSKYFHRSCLVPPCLLCQEATAPSPLAPVMPLNYPNRRSMLCNRTSMLPSKRNMLHLSNRSDVYLSRISMYTHTQDGAIKTTFSTYHIYATVPR